MTEKQDDPSSTPSTLTSRTSTGPKTYLELWEGVTDLKVSTVEDFY